jgi:hypothetical protein
MAPVPLTVDPMHGVPEDHGVATGAWSLFRGVIPGSTVGIKFE